MRMYINTSNYIDSYYFLWGINEENIPVYICVYHHETYFFVRTRNTEENLEKNQKLATQEKKNILCILGDGGVKLSKTKEAEIVKLYESQCYSKEQSTHYKIYLENFKELDTAKKTLKENNYFTPIMVSKDIKLFCDLGLKMCQWINIDEQKAYKLDFINSKSKRKPIQFITKSKYISACDENKLPPPIKVLNIDAETYSSRYGTLIKETGKISKAHPNYLISKDILYSMSMVFADSGTKQVEKSQILFVVDEDCPMKIENGEIIKVKTEKKLFEKFSQIIREEDPDMITGYNIQGFDFEYMKSRTESMGIESFGRLTSFEVKIPDPDYPIIKLNIMDEQSYNSKSWEGAGKIFHSYVTPEAYGRIVVDTFNLVKPIKVSKGAPGALQSHKLNDVGTFLVGETKEDITYAETYLGYRSKDPSELSRIASYCIQDSILNWKIFVKMNGVVFLREAANMYLQDMEKVLISGLNAKLFDNFLYRGENEGKCFYDYGNRKIFKIKGGFIQDPLIGKKTNVACIDFSSMYPSAQMARNFCISTYSPLKPKHLDPNDYYEFDIDIELDELEIPAYYQDYIHLFDIKKIDDGEYVYDFFSENILDLKYMKSFLNIVREENNMKAIKNYDHLKVFFVKEKICEGVFPKFVKELKEKRSEYKILMKQALKTNDMASYEIYDQRQKLVKIVMNSVYGVLGSPKGNLSCMPASASVSFFGRECIKQVDKFVKEKGCTVIYGDTDSIMFQIPGYVEQPFDCKADPKVIEYVKNLVEEINNFLPSPMKVEFEKLMNMVCVKKKQYFGIKTWEDEKYIDEAFMKGLAGIRGDSTPFAQEIFRTVIDMIKKNINNEEIINYIKDRFKLLKAGKIDKDMLIVFTLLSHSYKSETAAMNVYAKYLKSIGEMAEAGTKIGYYVAIGEGNTKSYNYRPPNAEDPIDYFHYFTRAIDPLKDFLSAALNVDIEKEINWENL